MRISSGSCLQWLLQLSIIILMVNALAVSKRHKRFHRVVKWTDKYGREGSRRNQDETAETSPKPTSRGHIFSTGAPEKGYDVHSKEVRGNDTIVSFASHFPSQSEETSGNLTGLEFCSGELPASRICDPADVLSPEAERKIVTYMRGICSDTGCPCGNCSRQHSSGCPGYRVTILVVPPHIHRDSDRSYQEFVHLANNLRTEVWQFGRCGEDIVIVLDTFTNQVFTSVGPTAALTLTPVCASEVLVDVQTLLAEKKHSLVLTQLLRDYRRVFLDEFKCVIQRDYYIMPTGHIIAIIFGSVCLPIMVCVISVFLGPCFRGSGFGGRRHKTTYSKYRYKAQNSDGTWAVGGGGEDNASLGESGRFGKAMDGAALGERRGAAVML